MLVSALVAVTLMVCWPHNPEHHSGLDAAGTSIANKLPGLDVRL